MTNHFDSSITLRSWSDGQTSEVGGEAQPIIIPMEVPPETREAVSPSEGTLSTQKLLSGLYSPLEAIIHTNAVTARDINPCVKFYYSTTFYTI